MAPNKDGVSLVAVGGAGSVRQVRVGTTAAVVPTSSPRRTTSSSSSSSENLPQPIRGAAAAVRVNLPRRQLLQVSPQRSPRARTQADILWAPPWTTTSFPQVHPLSSPPPPWSVNLCRGEAIVLVVSVRSVIFGVRCVCDCANWPLPPRRRPGNLDHARRFAKELEEILPVRKKGMRVGGQRWHFFSIPIGVVVNKLAVGPGFFVFYRFC